MPSQNQRVLAALRRGPVTQAMFLSSARYPVDGHWGTIDGGKSIPRLAARIGVLRDRGCEIRTEQDDKTAFARYVLVSEPDGSMVSAACGIEDGPEPERSATSPRPVSTTHAANFPPAQLTLELAA